MTLRYLLDTSTVSAVIAPKPDRRVLQRLGPREQQCALAALARVNELILVTANVKDFAGKFSDLEVEDWTSTARVR